MAAHLQRGTTPTSCVTSTGMPVQNAATILKLLVPNPHSTPSTSGATCCWLGCTIPLFLPQIPPYSPFTSHLFFPPLRTRELGVIIISMQWFVFRYAMRDVYSFLPPTPHLPTFPYRQEQKDEYLRLFIPSLSLIFFSWRWINLIYELIYSSALQPLFSYISFLLHLPSLAHSAGFPPIYSFPGLLATIGTIEE